MKRKQSQQTERQLRYAIRKFASGTSSVVIGVLLFGSIGMPQNVAAQSVSEVPTVADNEASLQLAEVTTPKVAPITPIAEAQPTAYTDKTEIAPTEKEETNRANITVSETDSPSSTVTALNVSETVNTRADVTVEAPHYQLHYTQPAKTTYEGWEHESLPIGNGEMGAKVFGLIGGEKIQFNEKTLWSGGPQPNSNHYNGGNFKSRYQYIEEIRKALERGDRVTAKRLAESKLVGPYSQEYGRYLAFGDIEIDFTNQSKSLDSVTQYQRSLDLNTAISTTTYTQAGVHYQRESFISYPDNVAVTHFSQVGDKPLEFTVKMRMTDDMVSSGLDRVRTYTNEKSTYKTGTLQYGPQGILLKGHVNDNQLNFAAYLGIQTDGTIQQDADLLRILNATYATLIMNAQTDYALNPKTNYRRSVDVEAEVKSVVASAMSKDYMTLKQAHVADYQSLFHRVSLRLSKSAPQTMETTDQLLHHYSSSNGQTLETLFFQYGRYLMITSSRNRPNALPANLQGVWNAVDNPPWNSDYHLNVNLQMNYWPVYSTNLSETALPLIQYIDDLRYYGRIAAAEYAGIVSREGEENGWLVHTQTTPFGWTTPGWSYYWGWAPSSNAWIMQNVYDYYKFTKDEPFLRQKIYPMLKETAKFWNAFLHYDEASDRWVSSPSYSPEHGTITIGNTYDQSLVWQLFHDFIEAANTLNVDQPLVQEIQVKYEKLKPLHINKVGQIKEWYEEDSQGFSELGEHGHRHVSHLVGLFPGTLFNKDNPLYLDAARQTLNDRGDGGTGWSKANKINLWARLLDGNRAHRLLAEQLRGSTLNNLWDTHSPFQIDGNFGATSGMTEMLLQSHNGYIAPLAALPDAWKDGAVSGLIARGNVTVNMEWEDKNLTALTLTANKGGLIQVDYPNIERAVVKINGKVVMPRLVQGNRIELNTAIGDVVTFESIMGRVTNVQVKRTGATQATITFNEIPNATRYSIHRTTVGNEAEQMTFHTVTPRYIDKGVLANRHYHYHISAETKEGLTAPSDAVELGTIKLILDDRDLSIEYGGLYADWQDDSLLGGTEKYADATANPNASDKDRTATIPFVGNGIEVYGIKSSHLGQAMLSIDGREIGEFDFYQAQTEKGALIARITQLTEGPHTLVIRLLPTHKGRKGERAKLSLDYFRILSSEVVESEYLDDRDTRITYGRAFGNWQDNVLFGATEKYADVHGHPEYTADDASMRFKFNGVGLNIYGIKSAGLGTATITIDGVQRAPLDFYNASGTVKSVLIGNYSNLTDGEHEVVVQVDRNVTRGRAKISLDYFEILKAQPEIVTPAYIQDITNNAMRAEVSVPQGNWDRLALQLPGQTAPIVVTFVDVQHVRIGEDMTPVEIVEGKIQVTLPRKFDRQVGGILRITAYRGERSSSEEIAVIQQGKAPQATEIVGWTANTQTLQLQHVSQPEIARIEVMIGEHSLVLHRQEDGQYQLNGERIAVTEDTLTLTLPAQVNVLVGTVVTVKILDIAENATTSEKVAPDTTPSKPEIPKEDDYVRFTDSATGITVAFSTKEPVPVVGLKAHAVTSLSDNAQRILNTLDYDVFDIEGLDQAGQDIEIQYPAIVTMPLDAGKTVARVIYISETGETVDLDYRVVDEFVVFTATHFSEYAVVYVSTMPPAQGEDTTMPVPQPEQPIPNQPESSMSTPESEPSQPTPIGQQPHMPSLQSMAVVPNRQARSLSSNQLPETGEASDWTVWSVAALSILASVGLVAPRKRSEE